MLVIYQVKPADKHLIVLDVMKVVQHIQHVCPGIEIQTVGPAQSILEIQYKKRSLRLSILCLSGCYYLLGPHWPS